MKRAAVKVRRRLVNIDQNSGRLVRGHSDLFQSYFFSPLTIDEHRTLDMQKVCLFPQQQKKGEREILLIWNKSPLCIGVRGTRGERKTLRNFLLPI